MSWEEAHGWVAQEVVELPLLPILECLNLHFQSEQSPMEFAEEIAKESDLYNPFNLVVADLCLKTMVFISNRPKGKPTIQTVNPGIHVLSNASLDTPWPKVTK
ncbi:Transport and Golgi organization protein 2 [Carex littledalei]|uniref:Transport and Golgi organization protein 2 n=1 Tax=Carex littledalei TaxID=544730 RepID=A0A833RC47_9POAL|nr:Transport and Golgi organization protein 2 [Carex littledalei]